MLLLLAFGNLPGATKRLTRRASSLPPGLKGGIDHQALCHPGIGGPRKHVCLRSLFTNTDPLAPARSELPSQAPLSSLGQGAVVALMGCKEMFLSKLEKPDEQPGPPWQAWVWQQGVLRGWQGQGGSGSTQGDAARDGVCSLGISIPSLEYKSLHPWRQDLLPPPTQLTCLGHPDSEGGHSLFPALWSPRLSSSRRVCHPLNLHTVGAPPVSPE